MDSEQKEMLKKELLRLDEQIFKAIFAITRDKVFKIAFPELNEEIDDPLQSQPSTRIQDAMNSKPVLNSWKTYYERYIRTLKHDIIIERHDPKGLYASLRRVVAIIDLLLEDLS
jgi:hypothetical protein